MKKTGALIAFATPSIRDAWISIQTPPIRNKPGRSRTAARFIRIPILATRTYRQADPIFDAPAFSRLRARVYERTSAIVVARTTSQKNRDVRL